MMKPAKAGKSDDLDDRTHLSLKKDAPAMRAGETKPEPAADLIASASCPGIHPGIRHAEAWMQFWRSTAVAKARPETATPTGGWVEAHRRRRSAVA